MFWAEAFQMILGELVILFSYKGTMKRRRTWSSGLELSFSDKVNIAFPLERRTLVFILIISPFCLSQQNILEERVSLLRGDFCRENRHFQSFCLLPIVDTFQNVHWHGSISSNWSQFLLSMVGERALVKSYNSWIELRSVEASKFSPHNLSEGKILASSRTQSSVREKPIDWSNDLESTRTTLFLLGMYATNHSIVFGSCYCISPVYIVLTTSA